MPICFHLVPQGVWEREDAGPDYAPEAFARDGFIHTTDDRLEMAAVANRFYREEAGPHVYLYIDKTRVRAPIVYEDAERRYPHIYGALNRDAVIAVRPARRDQTGDYLPPESL